VIDPAMGRVVAANPAGATRLGLRPDAASGTLDAAMPGLVRLRALMHEPLNGGRREPLVFWTAYGSESLLCNVSALSDAAAPALVLVSIVGADEEAADARSLFDTPAAAVLASPPPQTGEDAATMKKIARAIRAGFVRAKDEGEAVKSSSGEAETPKDQPERSQKMTPESQAEHSTYASKLAHELKTPLSAIVVAAEIMKEERLGAMGNERYHSYTADIHDNARHALDVINRLLGESVPEEAPPQLEPAELDLNAAAESSVSAMRPLAEEAKLRLDKELHTRLPKVIADAMTVKQILFNLLANALKFAKAGGEVRVVTGLGFDRSVFIAVQDDGPGMSAETIARVLDSEAPPKPARQEAGGLGIGLPLALALAKSNGARLEIDSTEGEGTVVALIFPKDRVAHAETSAVKPDSN
jgi:signal transduction histidine kinase